MAVKEESGVFLVWYSSTRARQSRNRRNCNHSATIEVQDAPSGTRIGLTSVQGALAVLLVDSQLVAFVQLPEAHGGSESAPAGAAAEATAVAAAPGRKMTSSGSSSSSTEAAEAASGGSGGSSRNNGSSNGSSSTRTRSSISIKSSIRASISLSSTRKGYGSGVWIKGMDHAVSWGMDQRMDRGVWIVCGSGALVHTLYFDSYPYVIGKWYILIYYDH